MVSMMRPEISFKYLKACTSMEADMSHVKDFVSIHLPTDTFYVGGVDRFAACSAGTPRSQSSRPGRSTTRLCRSSQAVCCTNEASFFEFIYRLWRIGLCIALVDLKCNKNMTATTATTTTPSTISAI